MNDLNNLIKEVMPILSMNANSFGESEEIQMDFTQKIGRFLSSNLNEDPELIFQLIKKLPTTLFLIKFQDNDKESIEFFAKAFNSFLTQDSEFSSSFKPDSAYVGYLSSSFPLEWFEIHKNFLTKEIFLSIEGKLNRKIRYLLKETTHLFAENYNSPQEFILDMHDVYYSSNKITIPEEIISIYKKDINAFVFSQLTSKIFNDKINYYKAVNRSKSLVSEYYGEFITDESIALFLKNNEDNLESYQYKKFFTDFGEFMSDDTFNKAARIFIFKSFDLAAKYQRQNTDFKDLPKGIRNRMSELALSMTPWAYINFSDKKRIELIDKVDFKLYQGLLSVHPFPEKVSSEDWFDAIKESKFNLKSAPEFIFVGDRSFTEDQWFDILSYKPNVPNNHFNFLAKSYKSIVSDDLLKRLSVLSGHPILNKAIVKDYIARTTYVINQKDNMIAILEVARLQDEKQLATQITKMFSIGLGTKENMESVLKAFKNG